MTVIEIHCGCDEHKNHDHLNVSCRFEVTGDGSTIEERTGVSL
jgi:hypothetical protein